NLGPSGQARGHSDPGAGWGGILFFFSSRRRHTRSKRDWSSDVCSSDLCGVLLVWARLTGFVNGLVVRMSITSLTIRIRGTRITRSEERRVGKERGARGRADSGTKRRME